MGDPPASPSSIKKVRQRQLDDGESTPVAGMRRGQAHAVVRDLSRPLCTGQVWDDASGLLGLEDGLHLSSPKDAGRMTFRCPGAAPDQH